MSKLPEGKYTLINKINQSREDFINFHPQKQHFPSVYLEFLLEDELKNKILRVLQKEKGRKTEPFKYQVHFNLRKAYWHYLVVPRDEGKIIDARIKDEEGHIQFTEAQEIQVNGKKVGYQLASTIPLAISQKPSYRFKLIALMERKGEFAETSQNLCYPDATKAIIEPLNKTEAYSEIKVHI